MQNQLKLSHLMVVRWVMAAYLAVHFIMLITYAGELFTTRGIFSDPAALPSHGFFPNPLFFAREGWQAAAFLALLAVTAVGLLFDKTARYAALALWFGWACLLSRSPFIANPSIPYIGLLLLVVAACPVKDLSAHTVAWRGMWVLMAVGYSISGLHKLGSPSWVDGSALSELLVNPLSRSNAITSVLATLPPPVLKALTWGTLAVECLFAPLALLRITRAPIWAATVLMHLGIVLVIDFADLTAGMLVLHLYTFDARWISSKQLRPIIFYDGTCGMCNRFIQWTLIRDDEQQFRFASLQSRFATEALPEAFTKDLSTVVVQMAPDRNLVRSTAVLEVFRQLGGGWALMSMFLLVPRCVRDSVYGIIARNRTRWFGPYDACRLVTPEERKRFIVD
jgi:predicted DCC family thiol-disulfide oxidoreductase YuxK